MKYQTRDVSPGPTERTAKLEDGKVVAVPEAWDLVPPGDAALTRRIKASGPCWTVKQKKGRRTFSLGVWADRRAIATIRCSLEAERSTDAYAKRRQSDLARRQKKQTAYVEDFYGAVIEFLAFAPEYQQLAERLARAVTDHATPVGSGTVARTQRIPIGRRAESAVIAWMRHQTTAYDHMKIARVKGKRREVRRMLAEESRRVLVGYRRGDRVDAAACPLQRTLMGEA